MMRGSDAISGSLFSYVDVEERIPATHPLRTIRTIVNEVLAALDADFEALYQGTGRQSIAPERLMRASLLQAFYSVRSERQLMEQINYNLLFRWFVGLGVDDVVWDHSTFSKNRDRLLDADVAAKFLAAVLRHPKVRGFLSDEHFSVDGTLVEAWASIKSFRAKDGSDQPPGPGRNGERHFHNEKRSNDTHASTTDPDAKLYRKGSGQAAKLCYMGHALMENRHGLVVGATLTPATGTAEREAALDMIVRRSPGAQRLTLGADKAYDTKSFVTDLRDFNVAPHVAQNTTNRASAIDGRTTRHPGYGVSQTIRKRIEESFAWAKTIAGLHKTKHRGVGRVAFQFTFAMAAYNLIRMPRLLAAA
jgi:transposase